MYTYRGIDEVEVATVRPEVDESLIHAQNPEQVGVSGSVTEHLSVTHSKTRDKQRERKNNTKRISSVR